MLIPLHMYMYLKLIDIIDTNFVLVIHVLIVNPVFMAKVQTKLLRNTDFNTVFLLCTLSWHNLQHPLHITVQSVMCCYMKMWLEES